MKFRWIYTLRAVAVLSLAFHWVGMAMTPSDLQRMKLQSERIVVVDIRSQSLFQRGHIPGAINIPEALIQHKQLPPIGRVVVCGSGLGKEDVAQAVQRLNVKPGIRAEPLDGGFAAWESVVGQTTQPPGMVEESLPFITYDQVKQGLDENMVLVDLRESDVDPRSLQSTAQPTFTDLRREFPGMAVVKSPFPQKVSLQSVSGASAEVPPLMVLIDNNDGKAQATARLLRSQGIHRIVILAGGESIIKRQGRAGLQRIGASQTFDPGDGQSTSTSSDAQ